MVTILKARLYFHYVTRAARRGGQRTLLAILCVAIGVMAIVAMQLIGNMVNRSLTGNVRDLNGGDLHVSGIILTASELPYFDQIQAQGVIAAYTAVSANQGSAQSPHPVSRFTISLVDPGRYPLAGAPTFVQPVGGRLSAILGGTTIILTSSLAEQMGARVGDQFTVILADGHLSSVTVGGIVESNGIFQQSFMLMSYGALASFHESSNQPLLYNEVYADVPGHSAAQTTTALNLLQGRFPSADIVTADDLLQNNQQEVYSIQSFLRLVGLAALLIGGMGIANTMQVLLRRRQTEIAMLKAEGYTATDLGILFGVEAGLLGLIGGVIGALAGILVSFVIKGYVEQAFSLSLPPTVDPILVAQGVLVGVAVALIFGLLPIAEASQIRPIAVLRDLPEGTRRLSRISVALLGLLVVALFYLLAFAILQSALLAAALIAGVCLVAAILNLVFSLVLSGISRLPVPAGSPGAGTVKPALRNLRRQRGRTVSTQIALFAGVFSVGLILVLGQSLQSQYASGGTGVNAVIWTTNLGPVQHRLAESSAVTRIDVYRSTSFAPAAINGHDITSAVSGHAYDQDGLAPLNGILGFDLLHPSVPLAPDFVLTSGRMLESRDAGTHNVVIDAATQNAPLRLKLGDRITVRYLDKRTFISGGGPSGQGVTCTIVGFYQNNTGIPSLQDTLLGDYAAVDAIGGSNAFYQLGIHVDPQRADALLTQIQTELPGQVFVHSYVDVFAQIENYLHNLVLVLEAIVLPALLAAAVNIANAVALAMLDRRRELAIQKAVGHTSRGLLAQIMLEQGIVALIPSLIALVLAAGLGLAVAAVIYQGGSSGGGGTLSMPIMAGILAASILIGIVIALLVSWGAAHRRPLEALRYQ
jgi:putative ABC transport system permease protein